MIMWPLILAATLGADFSQVRKMDSAMAPVYRAGFTTTMPAGVPELGTGGMWYAGDPLKWQLGNGTTTACTAANSTQSVLTPFCAANSYPPNTCSSTLNLITVSSANNFFEFGNPANQPGTDSFSVCVMAQQPTGSTVYAGTMNWGGGQGWTLFGNASIFCAFEVSDGGVGAHDAAAYALATVGAGMHLCCGTFTHGGNAVTYVDGVAQAGGSADGHSVGSASNTATFDIGNDPAHSSASVGIVFGGIWWFHKVALTPTEIGLINTAILANGFTPNFSALLLDQPSFAWLPSNPYINSINTGIPPLYQVGAPRLQTYAGKGNAQPIPGPPYCGSNDGTSPGCMVAQQFDGGQYFDCGAAAGDMGNGSVSPTNDFTVCALWSNIDAAFDYGVTKWDGAANAGYAIGAQGSQDLTYPGHQIDCRQLVGTYVDTVGTWGINYGDWTLCCGVYVQNDGTSHMALSPYQNGVMGTTRAGFQAADHTVTTYNMHNTQHLIIGSALANYYWIGKISAVWFWNQALTASQLSLMAGPFTSSFKSSEPYCLFVNNDWQCFSSGM